MSDYAKTEMIMWIAGWGAVIVFVLTVGYLFTIGMSYDTQLKTECMKVGGVWSYGAGACVFSK